MENDHKNKNMEVFNQGIWSKATICLLKSASFYNLSCLCFTSLCSISSSVIKRFGFKFCQHAPFYLGTALKRCPCRYSTLFPSDGCFCCVTCIFQAGSHLSCHTSSGPRKYQSKRATVGGGQCVARGRGAQHILLQLWRRRHQLPSMNFG